MSERSASIERIRDLEREVERLKGEVAVEKAISGKMRVYDMGAALADTAREADRADAERLRWLVGDGRYLRWESCSTTGIDWSFTTTRTDAEDIDIRALIDAAMAKDPQP